MVVFSILGALMFISKQLLEFLPNIHMLGMFTMLFAIVYRLKGLIPLYIFVLLEGVFCGFNLWWVPYLYIWSVLFFVTLLLPRNMKPRLAIPVYMVVCGLHGLCYGTMYAPFQAIWMGFSFRQMLTWIVAGLPWDCVHAAGNLVMGTLVLPLSRLLMRLESVKGV